MYYYTKTQKWYFKQKILRYKLNYTDWNNITSFFKPWYKSDKFYLFAIEKYILTVFLDSFENKIYWVSRYLEFAFTHYARGYVGNIFTDVF